MKIFLTGKPGVGKSTISQKVRDSFSGKKYGVVAREIRKSGKRVGFESVNMDGDVSVFAHKTDIQSDHIVGGEYHVDVEAIDSFVVAELEKGLDDPESLVFIDEIGRMQSFSEKFMGTVEKFLESDANILATIVYDPEPWSIGFKENPEVVLVEVTKQNRDELPVLLSLVFEESEVFHHLSEKQKQLVLKWMRVYFEKGQFMQVRKLFGNALGYVTDGKVESIGGDQYQVSGKTKPHVLTVGGKHEECDCDLFNGRGKYVGGAGECSHIQAVKLVRSEH